MSSKNETNALVPDVLATLAQLPNDEVFTPPALVDTMLDALPKEVWKNHTFRWLDPATKSGVYLRQVASRLMVGLADWEPDAMKRREHILSNMLFGAAATSLGAEISRRTIYQTTDATGASIADESIRALVIKLPTPDGNVKFVETEHTIYKGRCTICRAPQSLIRDRRESFAYSFIHETYPTKEMQDMKFDVIVGNPPYQIGMDDGRGNRTTNITPLYHMFVQRAIAMNPRYILMITPSRWFAGGHSLGEYRDKMLNDRRLRVIADYPDGKELFPGVAIMGGISYFLWDRDYSGDCRFLEMSNGICLSDALRDLRDGQGVIIRDNFAAKLVNKVIEAGMPLGSLADIVSTRDPFGPSITTNFKGSTSKKFAGAIPLVFNNKIEFVEPSKIEKNQSWIDRFKVLIPMSGDPRHGEEGLLVLGEPIALAPGSACTQSFLVAGVFDSALEAKNFASYLTSKFVRFLVLQRKVSQHVTQSRFKFVPNLDMSRSWSDAELYKHFNFSEGEIAYVEKKIGDRDWIDSLNSPIPSTHLPGGRKYKSGDTPVEDDEGDDD